MRTIAPIRTPPSGSHLDPVEAGQPADVDEPAGRGDADLHQVEQIRAARRDRRRPARRGGDRLGDRRRAQVIEAVHALLRSSVGDGLLRGIEHGCDDARVGAAAADIAAHPLADALGVVAGLAFAQQADGAHDLARRAVAALEAVMGDEGGLHRMQPVAFGEAFDRQDLGAVEADGEREAGIDPPAVDEHGAGAALAAVAALLGAGQVETLAQQVEQGDPGIVEGDVAAVAIDGQADRRHG